MAPKVLKRPAAVQKRPASRAPQARRPAAKRPATATARRPAAAEPEAEATATEVPEVLTRLKGFVVNLERRPDRWTRVETMLREGAPWLDFEQFKASDGAQNPIPEEEVSDTWSTTRNAHFADYYEWAFDAPDTPLDGTQWKWACDAPSEDDEWKFTEDGDDEWSYVHHAGETKVRTGTLVKKATEETFKVKLRFAQEYLEPGKVQRMSGGERGCAHSHLRLWRAAAEREQLTLALEDDVQLVFDRSDSSLGKMSGEVFTQRLARTLELAPTDFDVIYLGWSGWRDGHYRRWEQPEVERTEADSYFRKAEYVWTTVAYVISQAGAKKLLAAATPLNQPVDNFMAWEASQGRLNSYVALDEGDDDGTWAGGIVDQNDFQGDSDIKKSDGGHQGDDEKEFAVQE